MLIKGVGTRSILKLGEYKCHEQCVIGQYNIKNNFFDDEIKVSQENGENASNVTDGGERILTIFVDNLDAWMYSLKIFFEIRDSKTGKLLR